MSNDRFTAMANWKPAGALPETSSEVCIVNIDTAGRRQRLAAGIVQLVFGLGVLGVLLAVHASLWWRLPLLFVFWGAAVGFFQWRDRT